MGGKRWTDAEVEILYLYKDESFKKYSHLLPNRNSDTVYIKRKSLNIIKTKEEKMIPNVYCSNCNKHYRVYPSRVNDRKYHFCSDKCQSDWKSEKYKGEGNPFYGKVHSIEVLDKIILANKNKKVKKKLWTDEKLSTLKSYILEGHSYLEISEKMNLKKGQIHTASNRYRLNKYYTAYQHNSEGHILLDKSLKRMFPINDFENEKYIKETKNFIDIYDNTLNIAYEYNGIQHYIQKGTWNRNEEAWLNQKERDSRKKQWCLENNIPLIIIRYDEILSEQLIIEKLIENGIDYHEITSSVKSS